MVFSHRLWYVHPNLMNQFHQAFQQAKVLTEKHGGKLLGAWQTSIGHSNEVITVFGYDDPGHRARVLEARANDPEWPEVINSIWAVLKHWDTRAVVAAPNYPTYEGAASSSGVFLHRIWHIASGRMNDFHQAMREAVRLTQRQGVQLVGIWQTSIGHSNEVITIFRCNSLAELEDALARRAQDPEWPAAYEKLWEVVEDWYTWIARGTPYSSIR